MKRLYFLIPVFLLGACANSESSRLRSEIDDLQNQLIILQKRLANQSGPNVPTAEEVDKTTTELNRVSAVNSELSDRCQSLQGELDAWSRKFSKIKTKNRTLIEKNERLLDKNSKLEKQAMDSDNAAELKLANEELNAKLTELSARIEILNGDEQTVQVLEEKNKQLNKEVSRLSKQVENLTRDAKDIQSLQVENESLKNEISELSTRIQDMSEDAIEDKALQKKLDGIENEVETLTKKLNESELKHSELESKYKVLQKKNSDHALEAEAVEEILNNKYGVLNEKYEVLVKKNVELKKINIDLEGKYDSLVESSAARDDSAQKLEDKYNSQTEKFEAHKKNNLELEDRYNKLQRKLSAIIEKGPDTVELKKLKSANQLLEQKNNDLKYKNEVLEDKYQKLLASKPSAEKPAPLPEVKPEVKVDKPVDPETKGKLAHIVAPIAISSKQSRNALKRYGYFESIPDKADYVVVIIYKKSKSELAKQYSTIEDLEIAAKEMSASGGYRYTVYRYKRNKEVYDYLSSEKFSR